MLFVRYAVVDRPDRTVRQADERFDFPGRAVADAHVSIDVARCQPLHQPLPLADRRYGELVYGDDTRPADESRRGDAVLARPGACQVRMDDVGREVADGGAMRREATPVVVVLGSRNEAPPRAGSESRDALDDSRCETDHGHFDRRVERREKVCHAEVGAAPLDIVCVSNEAH
jgi:hypothetical protein